MGGVSMEWKHYKMDELIEEISMGPFGSDVKKEFYVDNGVPILNGSNLQGFKLKEDSFGYLTKEKADSLKKCNAHRGDIIVTHRGTLGQIVYVPVNSKYDRYVISQSQFRFRCKADLVDVQYLVYYFHTREGQYKILANASQVGVPALARATSTFRLIDIKLPPLDDQRRIASILSSLDWKIELNNKINADLEEMAQAIFKNWFVDFEPFKDGKFVDSELGMIPEGWKVISLNEILDNVSGYSYKGSELQSSNIAMATIKNFERKGGFKTEGYKEIVISKKIKETQFVNMFDVLVAHTDLTQNAEIVGNPAIVLSKGGYEKLIMSMDLTKVISKINGVTNGLLYCILSTSRFKEHALGYVNGTTVLHMSKKAVPEYTCAFPKDINQIRDLCITLDSIYKRMAVTYDENSRLSLLRDTLLPRLMSGELEVPE